MSSALLGSRRPTFALAPDAVSNAAGEACDLMRQLGRPLDLWQEDVEYLWLGERVDGSWAAFECFLWVQRQNGKGECTLCRELAGLFLFGERRIIHTAHKSETVRDAFLRTVELVEGSDDLTRRLKRINWKDGEEGIELMSGAELQFKVRSGRGKGRGLAGEVLVFDEGLFLMPEALTSMGPVLLAKPDAQVIYTSTPPLLATSHIVAVRRRAHAREERLAGAEWSNPEGVDVADPRVQAAVNPAYGRRITAERMRDMRRLLGDDGFAVECIGIWPDPDRELRWRVIGEAEWLARLVSGEDPRSRMTGRPALAVTSQRPNRSWVAITASGRNPAGERVVDVVEHWPGTRWAVPRLQELNKKHEPSVVVVDDQQLADEAEQAGLEVYRPTAGDMVSAAGMFYAAVADPDLSKRDLVQLGQKALTDAVAGAGKRTVGQGLWAWERISVMDDVCPLVGGSLALWAEATPRIHRQRLTPFALFG